jgi:hypothetical protein
VVGAGVETGAGCAEADRDPLAPPEIKPIKKNEKPAIATQPASLWLRRPAHDGRREKIV